MMLVFALAVGLPSVHADRFVFVLQHGGRVQGEWLNPDERPPNYRVRTHDGATISLPRWQVKQLLRQSSEEIQYNQIAPSYGDTVEAQWELAEWCRQHRLSEQRAVHLRRLLSLNPDHVPARRALGYTQVGREWQTRDDWYKDQGYVFYRGRWRLIQEVDLLESDHKRERAECHWLAKLKRLRDALETDRAVESYQQLHAIRDPHAVRALYENLSNERQLPVKLLYVELLGQIGSRNALIALINTSLNDPNVEVFYACVDEVVRFQSPTATVSYLRGLKDRNNVRVNRSAKALARIGQQDTIEPLIDALVTTHQIVIRAPSSTNALPISMTFASSNSRPNQPGNGNGFASLLPSGQMDGTSFSPGNDPRVVSVRVPNQEVLHSLVQLTNGTSFGFDQKAWKNWYALQRKQTENLTRSIAN